MPISIASYPSAVVTFTDHEDITDTIWADHVNALQREVVAVERALGTTPAGTFPDVKGRIAALEGVVDDKVSNEDAVHLAGLETLSGTKIFSAGYASAVMRTQVARDFDDFPVTSTTWTVTGASDCQIQMVAPPSGEVLVMVSANSWANGGAVLVDFQVFHNSISTPNKVRDASSYTSCFHNSTDRSRDVSFDIVTGLTPGDNYWFRVTYMITAGNGHIYDRAILLQPQP